MSVKGTPYNHRAIEQKWQKIWDDEKAFAATDDYSKPKYYALVEFPYHNPYLIKVKSIKLSTTKKTLEIGGKKKDAKFTIRVKKILPKKAMIKKVKYTSSNKKIATINQKGVVKAKKKGTCKIFVETTDGSKIKKACKITVKQVEKKPVVVPTPTPAVTPTPTPTLTPTPSQTAEPTPTSTPESALNE